MEITPHAVVGIAGHYDRLSHQGGWAVVLRVEGRQLVLHGPLPGTREADCEQHSTRQAISALRRLRAPLGAIEVTSEVKQSLVRAGLRGAHARSWAPARAWWKSASRTAGVRVTRKPNDAYSAARRMAEVAALTGAEKLRLLDKELDTPGNRAHSARQAKRRVEADERRAERTKRQPQRERDEINEYAVASGRESPSAVYRRPRSVAARPATRQPPVATFRIEPHPTTLGQGAETLEELLDLLGST